MRAFLLPVMLVSLVAAAQATPARSNRSDAAATPAAATPGKIMPAPTATGAGSAAPRVVLETAQGPITIRLRPEAAPKTCANFLKLVREGFYDGLTFHRVVPGFVIQGGDPNSRNDNPFDDGQGSPGYTVPAEFSLKHKKGSVAMARMPDVVNHDRASNGSQFYIALRDLPSLDGGYTVFGEVVAGWETIDKIVALADRKDIARTNENANPQKLALIRHARVDSSATVRN